MRAKWFGISVVVGLSCLLLSAAPASAGADDLVRQADKVVRNAERNMFNGKNQEADQLLGEAAALLEQVKAQDPGNARLKQTETKWSRVRKALDKKLGRTSAPAVSSERPLPPKPQPKAGASRPASGAPAAAAGGDKLPGGVTKRLKDITRQLDMAEGYLDRDAKNAKYRLGQAADLFAEIDKSYGGKFRPDHPDFTAVRTRFEELTAAAEARAAAEGEAKAAAAAGKAAMEEQSARWVAGFREYLAYPGQTGHNPEKLVFVPGTSEPEKFDEARRHFDAFRSFYEEYRDTAFPNGKTWELEDLADKQAPLRIREFEEGMSSRVGSVAGEAESGIDAAMAWLEKDNGWKSDRSVKPNLVDHNRMTAIREATDRVVSALGPEDAKAKAVKAKFDALVARDRENRRIRAERTFMTPDRYRGSDLGELKEKAQALVKNDRREGGEPLRCTVISENWREETVEEWTDTSKTTWRRRTTRHLTAQVAARTGDGVRLVTVALARDKQSDGSWGQLYGNLHQGSDPMLEANVNKDGP